MRDYDAPTGAAFVYGTMILAGVVLGLLVAGILMLDGVPWSTCWWMVPAGGVAADYLAPVRRQGLHGSRVARRRPPNVPRAVAALATR